ncbi:D-serine deaminase-like pyridoxal phosphate-dependent protein [Sphingomonas sp. PP-F2F-G114-C0414]|uniref:amino acid deaminase/aldolase n=1 Tax=Sphingomonas sp. PP-F2F-G114-C0414 TaxID=2135662 RepID=UPI000EF874DC|nr:amino acid deaminase/aldolase [Sphingomonas sp. PP-F2F-G114-C0414]RMB26716.1 D-serine deaminase-like pyridoxal phosphate-dependent protein [Sphingomonas sp. PP-F2F-G114-C0414]
MDDRDRFAPAATGAPTSDPYRRYVDALGAVRLPAAFVDLDALDRNGDRLGVRARGMPVRLVTKSIRSVGVLRYLLDRFPYLQGLLCFSPAEAAWLASQGFDDLVVAYPTVEPSEIARVAAAVQGGASITLMVDDAAQLDVIDRCAAAAGTSLAVAIDMDASTNFPGLRFGVYRSPVATAKAALALADAIARRRHLRLDGVMGYEGQIAGLNDAVPGQRVRNRIIRTLKARSIRDVHRRRGAIVAALTAAGHRLRFVNGGGTGSFESTARDPSVTELAAGSGFYLPGLFDHYAVTLGEPAAGFALPVTRRPAPGIVTCAGGGYPASGPIGPDRLPKPWLPTGATLIDNEGGGEVQTPVRLDSADALPIGAPVFFRHAKAGELCERFDTLLLVRGHDIVDRVATYRGDGQCFF